MRSPFALAAVGLSVIIVLLGTAIGVFTGWTATDGGTISVIRNGGWFDSRDCRQVVQPGSSITWTGFWSSEHPYPSTQRYFKVSAAPGADSNEVINVPSKDGVVMGVEGTFYFELTRDEPALCEFDDRFGTRTYPVTTDGDTEQLHAYEGDAAWSAFLNATLGNMVQNTLRREMSAVTCTDLIASCALAQSNTQAAADAVAAAANASGNPTADKIQGLQDAVNTAFAREITDTMGGAYLINVKFVLSKVAVDPKLQERITNAQASFAAVTEAQAAKQSAALQADANAERQRGYGSCPTCAQIDALKALPPNLTTYAPGGQFAVGPAR